MSLKKNTSQFQNILTVVIGVAFGVVALAVVFGALKQNTEGRSKAAQENTILKQWEFNGKTAEGWESQPSNKILVGNGYISLIQGKISSTLGISNSSIVTSLPKGLKSISFSIAVGTYVQKTQCPPPPACTGIVSIVGQDKSTLGCDLYVCKPLIQTRDAISKTAKIASLESRSIQTGVMCAQDVRICPDGSYVGRTGNGCIFESCPTVPIKGRLPIPGGRFTGSVYYKLVNKSTYEKPLAFAGVVDGRFRDITVKFPEIQGTTIEQIRIVFSSGLRSTESVKIDWIRLVAPGIVPQTVTPTPTVTPSSTPACQPRPYCPPGAKCKFMAPPEGLVYCPTPTVTPIPTTECFPRPYCPPGNICKLMAPPAGAVYCPTPTQCQPVRCPPPPSGCSYVNSSLCFCGTLLCSATINPTVTPTGTPIPTPNVDSAFKNAAKLDGTSSYIKLLQSNIIQPKLGFTMEGWFKPSYIGTSGYFISKSSGSLNSTVIFIQSEIDPQDNTKSRFHYEFRVVNSGGSCMMYSVTNDLIVPLSQALYWQHIAGVIQDSGKLDIFVNGQRSVSSSNAISGVCNQDIPIVIGARELALNSADGFIGGLIDEVRISNTSRYPENFYPSSIPFLSDANTLALYHLDQFSDAVNGLVQDFSGNGYTGAQWGTLSFTSH